MMCDEQKNLNNIDDDFIMLPIVDFVFKLLFADENNKDRLISLLSAILNIPKERFCDLEILNTELPKMFDEDKKGILDIKVRMSDGKQIDIEIQVVPSGYMPERSLFYWSKMYTTQIVEGETYDKLKKCITINIVDYEFLPINRMHTKYHIIEDETGYKLTDVLEIHFCELKKLRNSSELEDFDDPAVNWMKFIGAKTKGEMKMLAENNTSIKDAFDYLEIISKDEKKRLEYHARQALLMDQRTREKVAREEGKEEGREEGREEGDKLRIEKTVKRMIAKGYNDNQIAEIADISVEEVKKYR